MQVFNYKLIRSKTLLPFNEVALQERAMHAINLCAGMARSYRRCVLFGQTMAEQHQ
jgi:hypothetical protein